jgi:hypothetical protein
MRLISGVTQPPEVRFFPSFSKKKVGGREGGREKKFFEPYSLKKGV